MATITGICTVNLSHSYTFASGFFSGQKLPVALPTRNPTANYKTSGVAADQVNLVYAATLTFTASTPQTLDLTTLTDPNGGAVSFVRVRQIAIRVNSTTDGAGLTLGGAATNEWTGMLAAASGLHVLASTSSNDGFFLINAPNTTGYPVSGTSKNLLLTPTAHAFTVDVIIVGCNA